MLPTYNLEFFNNNLNDHLLAFTISNPLFLDVLLMEIRGKTISFSAFKKKKNKEKEEKLINENSLDPNFELLEAKREELENVRKEKMQGIIVRSRVRWAEEGEKPTKYFCGLESRHYVNKIIPKIIQENGNIINKQEEILNEVYNFIKNFMKIQITIRNKI